MEQAMNVSDEDLAATIAMLHLAEFKIHRSALPRYRSNVQDAHDRVRAALTLRSFDEARLTRLSNELAIIVQRREELEAELAARKVAHHPLHDLVMDAQSWQQIRTEMDSVIDETALEMTRILRDRELPAPANDSHPGGVA